MAKWLQTEVFSVAVINILRMSLAKEDLCPVEKPISNARRNLMVYDHNIYRIRIAQGVAVNNRSYPPLRGNNIYKVEWSCSLETLASLVVKGCPIKMVANSLYALNYERIKSTDDYELENPYHLALRKWVYAVRSNTFSDAAKFEGSKEILPFANQEEKTKQIKAPSQVKSLLCPAVVQSGPLAGHALLMRMTPSLRVIYILVCTYPKTAQFDVMSSAKPSRCSLILVQSGRPVSPTYLSPKSLQMIRANTTQIGCSQRRCGTTAAVACFYNSPNMVEGETIYKTGNGCNNDDDCKAHAGSSCDVGSGLCIEPETAAFSKIHHEVSSTAVDMDGNATNSQLDETSFLDKDIPEENSSKVENSINDLAYNLTSNATLDLEIVAPLPESNKRCPESAAMSDELRQIILFEHNSHRSEIARGFVKRKNGRGFPAAGNMLKLKYSCELEAFAFSYAANCVFNSSDPENRPDTGENFAIVRNATTFEEALQTAATTWWKALTSIRNAVGNDLVMRFYNPKLRFFQFAQMAWASTQDLGCAVVKCGEAFNVVCRYYPSGGHFAQQIYEPGPPCTKCAWGMKCEYATGLCEHPGDDDAAATSFSLWMVLLLIVGANLIDKR